MAKVTFSGDPSPRSRNPAQITHLGVVFPLGVPVEVAADIAARLAGHSHFTVGLEDVPETIRAVHRGRGSYSVMDGANELLQGLSKADAEAFNAMSPGEQVEYLAK